MSKPETTLDDSDIELEIKRLQDRLQKLEQLKLLQAQVWLMEKKRANGYAPKKMAMVTEIVAQHFNLEPSELVGSGRPEGVVIPRHMIFFICRKLNCGNSLMIARFFEREHSTVSVAAKSFQARLDTQPKLLAQYQTILEECRLKLESML